MSPSRRAKRAHRAGEEESNSSRKRVHSGETEAATAGTKKVLFCVVKHSTTTPLAMHLMQLQPEVLQLLNSPQTFAHYNDDNRDDTEESFLHKQGFEGPMSDGSHMNKKKHTYYEGYFCASGHNKNSIQSLNPRDDTMMDKPAAPIEVSAFVLAFKEANRSWLAPLIQDLDLPFLTLRSAFADVSAQLHYGQEVRPKPNNINSSGWHTDEPTASLLHLAITLKGTRSLHYLKHAEEKRGRRTIMKEVFSAQTLAAGDVYLSSPSIFQHAVEYPECKREGCSLALQCRTLLLKKPSNSKVNWKDKNRLVGQALREAEIKMPTWEQVQARIQELQSLHA